MKKPKVSVCIPVYGTEKVLRKCLDSVAMQDFAEKEIVVVSDASCGVNEKGEDAKKIVKKFAKETKVPVVFKEHLNNLGILETRRDLLSFSSGDFIFYIDSDDYLEGSNAISFLYNEAQRTNADIVNSTAIAVTENPEKNSAQQEHLQKNRQDNFGRAFWKSDFRRLLCKLQALRFFVGQAYKKIFDGKSVFFYSVYRMHHGGRSLPLLFSFGFCKKIFWSAGTLLQIFRGFRNFKRAVNYGYWAVAACVFRGIGVCSSCAVYTVSRRSLP